MNDATFTRSQNNKGLTQREKSIWPPKRRLSEDALELAFWFALACLTLATFIHFTVEPETQTIVKHAQGQLSDREQDRKNCAWAIQGTPVHNSNPSLLESYCLAHG